MTLRERWQRWRSDQLLQPILKNTGYLFSSNTLAMLLGMLQSIFAARLLGVTGFGIIGTVTVFASTINRLFSFRMGDLTVKYLGEFVTRGEKEKAGALVKVGALTEAGTSLLAFAVLVVLHGWATPLFEAPDEVWHYAYVRWLAEGHGLPSMKDNASGANQEVAQPPLYYAVAAFAQRPLPR